MANCMNCRWHLQYRCPRVKNHCKFKLPAFAAGGKDCDRYKPRKEG